jgi:hypothetical protein
MPHVISDMLGAICTVLSEITLVRLLVERSGNQCGRQRWEDGAVLGNFGWERGGGTAANRQRSGC